MRSASMPPKLQQILRNIGKACQSEKITEAEIEKIFQANGFFVALGYEGFGQDLLAQRGKLRKRFDVARCPRFASFFWTLTWAEEGSGRAHRTFSTHDLGPSIPIRSPPLR